MAQQNKQSLLIYGAATAVIAALSIGFVYYIVEDDRKVQRRKTARRAERNTLRLLSQIEQQQGAIASSISSVEPIIELECDDKAFKQKEYTLAQSNELLLRLMEQLDAIQPLTVIVVGQDSEPTEFEKELVSHLKDKKRAVIDSINGLFRRLDACNEKMKKEVVKREEVAKEKARIEREEEERLAREEEERKRIEQEKAEKAKEEQERVAKEEALRRIEEERAAQEEIMKEADKHETIEHAVEEVLSHIADKSEDVEEAAQEVFSKITDKAESIKQAVEEVFSKDTDKVEDVEQATPRDIEQVEIERPEEEGSGIIVQAESSTIELNETQ
jgi:hypothetical protein